MYLLEGLRWEVPDGEEALVGAIKVRFLAGRTLYLGTSWILIAPI